MTATDDPARVCAWQRRDGFDASEVEAWFLPADDLETALARLGEPGADGDSIEIDTSTLHSIVTARTTKSATNAGTDRTDPEFHGLLVIRSETAIARSRSIPRGAVPCRRLGLGAFSTLETVPDPPIDGLDIAHGVLSSGPPASDGDVHFLHPRIGWVRLAEGDGKSLVEFFVAPGRRAESWDRARAGETQNERLVGIEVESEVDSVEGMPSARSEIGSESVWDLVGDPRRSRELDEWLRDRPELDAAGPEVGRSRGLRSRLGRWREKRARQREARAQVASLLRLVDLLDSDPEEGLRHAIPLVRGGGRGGDWAEELRERRLDFDLDRLQGGGRGVVWAVPPPIERELEQRYRRLALRATELGDHRGAATIHAHLLGDLTQASACLRAGGFHYEAARLLDEHLAAPWDAAQSYEEAGAHAEAEALYVKLSAWTDACRVARARGDVDARLDYAGRALDEARSRGDVLAAADLLIAQLDRPEEGLDLLEREWPHAEEPIEPLLQLIDEVEHRNDAARLRAVVHSVPTHVPIESLRLDDLLTRLARMVERGGAASVRHAASDALRALVARQLLRADRAGVGRLLRAEPWDAGLAADVDRYRSQSPVRAVSTPAAFVVARFDGERPEALIAMRRTAVVVTSTDEVLVARWYGPSIAEPGGAAVSSARWPQDASDDRAVLVSSPPSPRLPVLLARAGAAPLLGSVDPARSDAARSSYRTLLQPDAPTRSIDLGVPPWLACEPLALTFDPDGTLWVVRDSSGTLTLNAYSTRGLLLRHLALPRGVQSLRRSIPATPLFLHAGQHRIVVLAGSHLSVLDLIAKEWHTSSLLDQARAFAASPHPTSRLAVAFEQGAALIELEAGSRTVVPIAQSDSDLVVTFQTPARLAYATTGLLRIVDPTSPRSSLIAEARGEWSRPVAIASLHPGAIALLDQAGTLWHIRPLP